MSRNLFCLKCGDGLFAEDPVDYHQACIVQCRIEGCSQPPVHRNGTLCDSHKGIGLTPAFCKGCGVVLFTTDPEDYHRACFPAVTPPHEVLAALEEWFKAYPGTIPFLRKLMRDVPKHLFVLGDYRAAVGDLCVVIEDMHIKAVGTRTRPAIYGGSHSGGKMRMAEQQNKAFHEKDPDYVVKLMTPANMPGKTHDGLWGALMQAEFNELPNKCPGCDGPTAETEPGWWHVRCHEAFKRGRISIEKALEVKP